MSVVTRFAPSPTGFLHIGGARTALFNWLYARGRGGKMHLRIEDTDRERSTQAAIDAILDGLTWLGIDWDGEAIFQFSRSLRHRDVADQLLAAGRAYYCYASPEELAQMREAARRDERKDRRQRLSAGARNLPYAPFGAPPPFFAWRRISFWLGGEQTSGREQKAQRENASCILHRRVGENAKIQAELRSL